MAALMQSGVTTMFGNLSLGRRQGWCSNATSSKLAMGAKNTFHVEVAVGEDEPQDNAIKRFRRAVMNSGLIYEARRRRRFEDAQDVKKRKAKEISQRNAKARRNRVFPTPTFEETATFEPAPFADLFGDPDDLFDAGEVIPSFQPQYRQNRDQARPANNNRY